VIQFADGVTVGVGVGVGVVVEQEPITPTTENVEVIES
jgi:hypothetical protein